MKTTVKALKKGELFTKKEIENPTEMQVWIRGKYDRSVKRYEIQCWGDTNKIEYVKGETAAYTEIRFLKEIKQSMLTSTQPERIIMYKVLTYEYHNGKLIHKSGDDCYFETKESAERCAEKLRKLDETFKRPGYYTIELTVKVIKEMD